MLEEKESANYDYLEYLVYRMQLTNDKILELLYIKFFIKMDR